MDINRNAPAIASAEAYIDAPVSVVWAVQTDLLSWPQWNPDVSSVSFGGSLVRGTDFQWKAGGMPISSTLQVVDEGLLVRILALPMRRMLATTLEKNLDALKSEAERRARDGAT